MFETKELSAVIKENIKKAQSEEVFYEKIFSDTDLTTGQNEFLFFIKPEITLPSDSVKIDKILEIIMDKIKLFGLNIHDVSILSAKYLEQYNIIAQHYGVINQIASNAVQNLSESAKEKFKELYGVSVEEVKVMGGVEFLKQYGLFNAYTLDYLWQNSKNEKLAGGTYSEKLKIDNDIIYLVNGFHPRQLKHFTEIGKSIVVMTLSGDLSWTDARSNFIGATNPNNANNGSLRREFLERKVELGLAEVSQGSNGVHLSAGPVEALIELRRYNSDFTKSDGVKDFADFSFGKKLKESFTDEEFSKIVENKNVNVNGKMTSIFDLTEEKNSADAIEIIKQHIG